MTTYRDTSAILQPFNKALVQKQALRSWNLKSAIPALLQAMVKCFLNLLAHDIKNIRSKSIFL